jgi:hypothetical protein
VRKYDRYLLLAFVVASIIIWLILMVLPARMTFPYEIKGTDPSYHIAAALYGGLAVVGLGIATRYAKGDRGFFVRIGALAVVFMVCGVARTLIWNPHPEPDETTVNLIIAAVSAIGVAFAVAYLAHCVYMRYLPSTIMRVRDITPLLQEGKPAPKDRVRHARRARWLFDLDDREYIDTTKLHLKTRYCADKLLYEWGEATFWSIVLVFSFSIYIDVYPRVAQAFAIILTSLMAGHLLSIIPLLMLPAYAVDRLGAEIPVEKGSFKLAEGFRHTAYRWTKLSFVPIIVIAILVRLMNRAGIPALEDVMLISGPTVAMVNLVYIERFRDLTVAETHRTIREREKEECQLWGADDWCRISLLEAVETLECPEDGT